MKRTLIWDDLHLVLTITRTGSLSGAGRALGKSHATIYRRLGSIEENLGVLLFHRQRSGYRPTPAGERLSQAAAAMEAQLLDAERAVAGQDLRPSGTVRMTTLDSFLFGFLGPVISGFRTEFPAIKLEMVISNHLISLSRRQADVALRPARSPRDTLVGRRVSGLSYAVYVKEGLETDLASADWIGPDDSLHYPELEAWIRAQGVQECGYRVNSVAAMHAGVAEGMGCAVLPCYLGDPDHRLKRLSDCISDLATDLWLLTHPDLRRTRRIRALMDYVSDRIKPLRDRLEGRDSHGQRPGSRR